MIGAAGAGIRAESPSVRPGIVRRSGQPSFAAPFTMPKDKLMTLGGGGGPVVVLRVSCSRLPIFEDHYETEKS